MHLMEETVNYALRACLSGRILLVGESRGNEIINLF